MLEIVFAGDMVGHVLWEGTLLQKHLHHLHGLLLAELVLRASRQSHATYPYLLRVSSTSSSQSYAPPSSSHQPNSLHRHVLFSLIRSLNKTAIDLRAGDMRKAVSNRYGFLESREPVITTSVSASPSIRLKEEDFLKGSCIKMQSH